jgi:hypothetical protein
VSWIELQNGLLGQEASRSHGHRGVPQAFEELARLENPFAYPIQYVKPRS